MAVRLLCGIPRFLDFLIEGPLLLCGALGFVQPDGELAEFAIEAEWRLVIPVVHDGGAYGRKEILNCRGRETQGANIRPAFRRTPFEASLNVVSF